MYDALVEPLVHKIRIDVAKEISLFKPKTVLDMCCGTGSQLKYLKGYGVDISWNMIRHSIEKGVNCVMSDARLTPFKSSFFESIVIEFALHEKSRDVRIGILNEIDRLLKPNGVVFILDYSVQHGLHGLFISLIERLAGGEHYRNYKDFIKNGCNRLCI